MSESDGINELVDDGLRQAVMVGARIGEQLARRRQEQLRQARTVSEHEGRQAQARFDAERLGARAGLADVTERDWWRIASPEQIGAAYETATAWKDHDPEIAAVHTYLNERLANRGIDTSGQPETITELIRAREWAAQYEPGLSAGYSRDMIKNVSKEDRERMNNVLVASYLARPESQYASAADDERAAALGDRREAGHQRGVGNADASTGVDLEASAQRSQQDALFPVYDFRKDDLRYEKITKDQALSKLERMKSNVEYVPGITNDIAEARGWLGIDPEVDEAVATKYPALVTDDPKSRVQFVDSDVAYDSADRRNAFAGKLDARADQSDKRARMLADLSQGTPAVAAVNGPRPNAPKARKNTAAPNRQMRKGSR